MHRDSSLGGNGGSYLANAQQQKAGQPGYQLLFFLKHAGEVHHGAVMDDYLVLKQVLTYRMLIADTDRQVFPIAFQASCRRSAPGCFPDPQIRDNDLLEPQ
jgi:hypothetical protein